MNQIILIGRLVKNNELRYTTNQIAILNNTIAVERKVKSSNGEKATDFINLVFFKKTAELVSKYTAKGSQIAVIGSLHQENYVSDDGSKKTTYKVIVSEVKFLDTKKQEGTEVTKEEVKPSDFDVYSEFGKEVVENAIDNEEFEESLPF
jgi:single-strand binding protein|nr:MAG TPA: Single strand binding protein [Caudoviricetes sp.]